MDNCPAATNPDQEDFDSDGAGDACETAAALADIDGYGHAAILRLPTPQMPVRLGPS